MSGAAPIYLDNAATTAMDPRIAEEMRRVATEVYGNPSSRHRMGLDAERVVRQARQEVAAAVGAEADEVIFTSGATEALALAILGVARQQRQGGHVLYSAIEHPAVRNTVRMLEQYGHRVDEVPVDPADGRLDLQQLEKRLRADTFLFALMHVNNEIGVIQPVGRAARIAKKANPRCVVLSDVVQSLGLMPVEMDRLGANMVAASAHKLHGPKGVGCLVCRGKAPAPLWGGGEQERGLRSGTENVPGIVAFGMACALGKGDPQRLGRWTRLIANRLHEGVGAQPLFAEGQRAPHIVALRIPGVRSEVAVNALAEAGVFVSSGSACHGRRSLKSPVLAAIGIPDADDVLRLSLGRFNTEDEVLDASERMVAVLASLGPERKKG